jgi:hypothetical protein
VTRILATVLVPLLVPTVLYFLWLAARRRIVFAAVNWYAAWPWLLGSGVALTAVTLVIVSLGYGSAPEGRYVPPRVIDGKVAPGHMAASPKP